MRRARMMRGSYRVQYWKICKILLKHNQPKKQHVNGNMYKWRQKTPKPFAAVSHSFTFLENMRRDLESQAVEDSFLGVSSAGRFGSSLCLF